MTEETTGGWFCGSSAKPRAAELSFLLFYLLLPGCGCLNKPELFTVPCGPALCCLGGRLGLGLSTRLGGAGRLSLTALLSV